MFFPAPASLPCRSSSLLTSLNFHCTDRRMGLREGKAHMKGHRIRHVFSYQEARDFRDASLSNFDLMVNTPQYIAEKGLFMGTEWESHGGWGKALNRNGVGKWRRKEGRSEIKIKRNGAGQCCIETYCFVNQELEG